MPDSGFRGARNDLTCGFQDEFRCTNRSTDELKCFIIRRFEQPGRLAPMTSGTMMQIALRVIAGSILAI
jgi:hypothetical protein